MVNYIPLTMSFYKDPRIVKLLIEKKYNVVIAIQRILLLMAEKIETRTNKKPKLEADDFDVIAFDLHEDIDIVREAITKTEFFKFIEEDSKKYIISDYSEAFYEKMKAKSIINSANAKKKGKKRREPMATSYNHISPTIDEVKRYCLEKNYDPKLFDDEKSYIHIANTSNWQGEIDSMARLYKTFRN